MSVMGSPFQWLHLILFLDLSYLMGPLNKINKINQETQSNQCNRELKRWRLSSGLDGQPRWLDAAVFCSEGLGFHDDVPRGRKEAEGKLTGSLQFCPH